MNEMFAKCDFGKNLKEFYLRRSCVEDANRE